jgi:hypothetical protein
MHDKKLSWLIVMNWLEPNSSKIPVDAEGYGEAPPLHSLAALISISLDTD